jgi:hypothetical protein
LATAKFLTHFIISIAVLENVPLSRVTEKSNFSTLYVGLARTGNRTRATCMAGSVSRRSAIHYAFFIILTRGMIDFLGVEEDETIVYAVNSNVWQTGSKWEEVSRKLTEKASLFLEYTRRMGLSINAAKTQLLFSSCARYMAETTVEVDGNHIHPSDVIELLGVRYNRSLSTTPLVKALLAAVRQQASVVARLVNHLPRGA